MNGERVLVVSNRLPVTASVHDGKVTLRPSAGGLATGLGGVHEDSGGMWLGWPGKLGRLDPAARADVDRQLERMRVVPIALSREEVRRYYLGYANGVLWPMFHYLLESVPRVAPDWEVYQQVNRKFAAAVIERWREGDLIWVHDYQLMLVPGLIRRALPRARIGFFLHIPFPASEVFRTLPPREELLEGLLGADLIGFHTADYLRCFSMSVLRVLGTACDVDRLRWRGREVRLGVFPMGIDAAGFAALGDDAEVQAEARRLHPDPDTRVLVGIDRLDYTKGIPRRLLAFERLLATHPELRERVRLVQVAVPTRLDVAAYARFRRSVERLVGRINGAFATPSWSPVHYIFRSLPQREVVALYRLADVMLVTPLRDGMNLVAKEFVAARTDGDGVLVLSEFAGAAAELAEAVQVNPHDIDGTAAALYEALTMDPADRRVRMAGLRHRVLTYDVKRWRDDFLATLREAAAAGGPEGLRPSPAGALQQALDQIAQAPRLLLLLDYDGTLVGFKQAPDLALPGHELLALLRRLAARPATEVHVVSGRPCAVLERWLGRLPIGLHAEHGLWSRLPGHATWSRLEVPTATWREKVRAVLEEVTARTPGSLIEDKGLGLAWHYRAADSQFGQRQANELQLHLTQMLSNVPVEILTSQLAIEVRPHGVHKGRVVERLVGDLAPGAQLVAMGDDRTDEDMFTALPPGALAIHVGSEPSVAPLRIATPAEARAWLARIPS